MYYKLRYVIEIKEKNTTCEFAEIIEADSLQEAEKKAKKILKTEIKPFLKTVNVLGVFQVSIDELIEEEKKTLIHTLFKRYLASKLKIEDYTSEEYLELKNKYLNNPENFYKLLKHENKALQIENMFGRFSNSKTIDLNKISAKQYFEKVIAMTNAKTEDGYRKIILE